ncbi:MAG: hypothetical protein JOZ20_06595, partial [Sphingomonas sp.]|nr:hypothetical protein [Sphingomonas sp.]
MKIRYLAGVACAALMGLTVPAEAATTPEMPGVATLDPAAGSAVSAFYASRHGAPLWMKEGAAQQLIGVLQRAALDGMPAGPNLAAQAQGLLARAGAGDAAAA